MPSIISAGTTTGTALSLTSDTSGELQIQTNNGATTAMTLTTAGNVGVGTTSPVNFAGYVTFDLNDTTGGLLSLSSNGTSKFQMYVNGVSTNLITVPAEPLIFGTNNAERMRIDSAGNVGIGTSSPSTKLHVEQSTTGDAFKVARGGNYIIMGGSGSGTQYIKGYEGVVAFGNEFAGSTTFLTNNTERMRITSAGDVGIGTSSPSSRLHTVTSSGENKLIVEATAVSQAATVSLITNSTTPGQAILYMGKNGATTNGQVGYDPNSNFLYLYTNNTERMRIDSSGNLLVNGTTQYAKLTVARNDADTYNYASNSISNQADHMLFLNSGTTVGSIQRFGGSAVVYNTTSDRRLKSNIADANPVLNKLMDVKVRQFDWTKGDLHQEAGFIAQELEPILSGVVTKGKTESDIWQLDYARLTPYLVKAIQEQQALIENLTTRLNALEGK
jgi:hypothetical protein